MNLNEKRTLLTLVETTEELKVSIAAWIQEVKRLKAELVAQEERKQLNSTNAEEKPRNKARRTSNKKNET